MLIAIAIVEQKNSQDYPVEVNTNVRNNDTQASTAIEGEKGSVIAQE